jgi:ArsR family transcriptional regulator, arsenate/arsenite/antimonite-responsive transcriptional repressor / arsenate reductase (thioredoxin)
MVSPGQVPPFVRMAAHPVRWSLLTALAGSDLRVRELTEQAGQPQNLVSYHLRLLRDSGLVTARRSAFDGRDSYYHLDLDRCAGALSETGTALHPALSAARARPAVSSTRPRVLFACTGNSARSPIAEALLRSHGGVEVTSAGSHPKQETHPLAVRVLREQFGIDIAGRRPRHLGSLTGRRFDVVITLCDKVREVRPGLAGDPRPVHWSLPDPGDHAEFAGVAAQLDTRVRHLLPTLTPRAPGGRP